jgi:type II secretory pathway pseudopilin PulG
MPPSLHPQKRRDRGSILLAVVLAVVVLSILLASIIRYSSNTHRNSVRQTRMEKAKLVAESEMEYLFYRWITEVNLGTASNLVASEMVTDGHCVSAMTTNQTPFTDAISSDGWQVARSVEYYTIPGTPDGSAIGRKPGTTKTGRNYYFTARVRASKPDPTFGTIAYRAGRRFVRSETSILQYSVFYQDDLEIASGSDMIINGPVSTNGSAYIGAQAGVDITITDKVRVFGQFNGADDTMSGTTLRKVAGTALHAPIFDANPHDGTTPDQADARAAQVEKLDSQENFVGGVNITKALADYPDAYRNSGGNVDANEVYRSIIAPPPEQVDGTPITEDPTVASKRMYNRAGIIVTVGVDTDGNTTVNVGNAADPTAFNAAVALHIGDIVPTDTRRKDMYDKREQKTMKVTTVNIGALNTALAALPALSSAYNGVVYIHDETTGTRGRGDGSGIRLTNAATLPNLSDAAGQPKGFAVVSNNAMYVQGDYNTTVIADGAGTRTNPAAILGDAVTLLSEGWSDDNAGADIYTRRADPAGASTTMTVNSAILTGNTPSNPTGSPPVNSGGVQNLVRLMEDWSGYRISIKGSMGQLFMSKFMDATFKGPSTALPDGDYVYWVPDERVLDFDSDLARRPPAWTPTTTEFHRGDFFTWDS